MPSAFASRGLLIETGLPSMQDLAGVRRVGARQDAHQRRLAGAVAADQADDLAGLEVDGHLVDRVDAAERDADVAHLDERRREATVDRGGAPRPVRSGRPA